MSQPLNEQVLLVSLGALLPLPATFVSSVLLQDRQQEQQREAEQRAVSFDLAKEWLSIKSGDPREEAKRLVKRKAYVPSPGQPTLPGEASLWARWALFEKVGALMFAGATTRDQLIVHEALAEDAAIWCRLTEAHLANSRQRPIDPYRNHLPGRALHALKMITGDAVCPSDANWGVREQPTIEPSWDLTRITAILFNDEPSHGPVPAICVPCKDDANRVIGHWLVFPPFERLPPRGEVKFEVWVTNHDVGIPLSVRVASSPRDFQPVGTAGPSSGPSPTAIPTG